MYVCIYTFWYVHICMYVSIDQANIVKRKLCFLLKNYAGTYAFTYFGTYIWMYVLFKLILFKGNYVFYSKVMFSYSCA